jgi:hypothetical protein
VLGALAALGEHARALALLEQGANERQGDVLGLAQDPFLAALRAEARFARAARRTDGADVGGVRPLGQGGLRAARRQPATRL